MRKLFILLCAFAALTLSGAANAQGVRVGNASSAPVSTATLLSTKVLVPVPSAIVQFCLAPASGVPCVNKATTYSDSTLVTPCATSTQVVLDGTSTCVAATDSLGNWGVWVPAGVQYAYTFTSTAGNFGPYYITSPVMGAPAGGVQAAQVAFGTALNTVTGSANFTWDNTNKSLTVMNSGVGGFAPIYALALGVTVNEAGIVAQCQQLANAFCEAGQFVASDLGAGPIGSVIGIAAVPGHAASGTLATMTGVDVTPSVSGGAGAITTSRGIHVGGVSFPTGTSPTTHDGIIIDDQCAGSFPATNCTGIRVAAQSNGKAGVGAANINGIRFVDGTGYATVTAAVSSCPAAPTQCTVVIAANYVGADLAVCPTANVTLWDLRSQTYVSNPVHYAFNVWDGCPASKWLATNTGGQGRSKFYTGYQPPVAGSPGDIGAFFAMIPTAGVWPAAGASGNVQESIGCNQLIQSTTDTITNANANSSNAIACEELFNSTIGMGLLLNDLRGSTAGLASGTGTGQVNRNVNYDAVATNLPATVHVLQSTGLRGEDPTGGSETVGFSGTLSATNGSPTVTWATGDKFSHDVFPGQPITIGGVVYVISTCAFGGLSCTLGINFIAATNTYAYSMVGGLYSAWHTGNQRYDATTGTPGSGDPLGGEGILFDAPSGGSATQQKIWFRDTSATRNADGTYVRMGHWMGVCSDGSSGMIWTDSAGVRRACINVAGTFFAGLNRGAQFVADQGNPCTNGELALSANWGNTGAPTVTAVAGTGQTCQWTITAGGAATGASPTITDTLPNILASALTVCDMRMVGGTGVATLINQTSLSATAPIFTFGGTPGAGLTYIVVRRCGP